VTVTPDTLTPVPPAPPAHPGRTTNRRLIVAGGAIVLALGFVLFRGLGDATVYFRTADEAVEQRASLGTKRFRIEGVVVAGTTRTTPTGVTFVISENGADVTVRHQGDPPELFRPDIPVVLEGRFAPASEQPPAGATGAAANPVFQSDRIMVKHTSEYRQGNPDRVEDYPATPAP
jgi:cytochrome c-type biogenesis protein CcmE